MCPRACRLHEGQRGLCFVRGRRRRPDRADLVRPVQRILCRSRREEAAEPFPAGHAGVVLRHRRAATWPASSARTGTSPSRGRSTPSADRRPRMNSPRPRRRWVAAASRSPTTTRRSSWSMRSTWPTPADERGIKAIAVTAGYIEPAAAARPLRAHGRRERRPQGVHRRVLPQGLRRAAGRRAGHARYLRTKPTSGSRSPRCSSPAATTPTRRSTPRSHGSREHLGSDVPLHFTAFHPDYKMLRRSGHTPATR